MSVALHLLNSVIENYFNLHWIKAFDFKLINLFIKIITIIIQNIHTIYDQYDLSLRINY